MKTRILAAVLALACLGAARLPSERDTWQRGTSAHFTFYTNAEERRVRELAANLERLVDLLASRKGAKASPVPTAIYVFRDDKSFQPYKRNPDGSVKSLAGFFVQDDLSNFVALDGSTSTPRVILHEYLHQFSAYNFPALPLWLDEGLAEFYSTFSTSDKGAQVGRPVHEHVLWLRANKLIPLPRLFGVAHDDPEYNEQSKQGVFYAESWALVHLLLLGDQATYGTQLTDYIDRLHRGQSAKEALAVLGDLGALQKQLESYVRRNAFIYRNEAFKDGDVAAAVAFQPLSREDTLFRLGDLLLHTSELQAEAADHFRAALALAPKHGGALGGLALIEAEAGRWAQAVPGFEAAVAATPEDPELRLRLAQALYQAEFEERSRPAEGGIPQRLLLAREHAAKAVALRPDTFDSQFLLGLTYAFQSKDVEPGITALERAHALAPGRSDVLLALGGLQMTAAHWDDAKASLAEVARSASAPVLAAQARESMAEIAVTQAFEEFNRTQDAAKATAAIRAALPDLDPQRRVEAEDQLARLEALRAGTIGSIDEVTKPPMDSDDLDAHLQFGAQQGRASQRAQGEASERLANESVQHFRRAAEIDATSDEAWLGLAAACATARCPAAEGKQAAEKGLELKPGDLQGTYLLAHYCIEGEQYARAREMLLPLVDVDHPMRDELRFMHVRARVENAEALIRKGKPGEALKLLGDGPLPEGERGREAREWIAATRGDAELRYWAGRLTAGSEARQAGQTDKARKILEDVVAHCSNQDILKLARQELAATKVK